MKVPDPKKAAAAFLKARPEIVFELGHAFQDSRTGWRVERHPESDHVVREMREYGLIEALGDQPSTPGTGYHLTAYGLRVRAVLIARRAA